MMETVQWTTPSPLWEAAIGQNSAISRRKELNRPSILRFATDEFMDDFLKMLDHDPRKLVQYVAVPETWRGISPPPEKITPAPAFAREFQRMGLIAAYKKAKNGTLSQANNQSAAIAGSTTGKLKLYQPAHQRFYLISACLVCERPGLPDKTLQTGREEKVSFVLRRLFPKGELDVGKKLPDLDSSWEEYAYVMTDQGARWKRIDDSKKTTLVADEEKLPLFAVNFTENDGRGRRLFAGVIPAGRREAYLAAGKAAVNEDDSSASDAPPDSRILLMRAIFRDPWKSLLQSVSSAKKTAKEKTDDSPTQPEEVITVLVKNSREQVQAVSWLTLLDFANYLKKTLPRIWSSLNGRVVSPALNSAETNLISAITATALDDAFAADLILNTTYTIAQVKRSLKDALLAIKPANENPPGDIEKKLESVVISYSRNSPDALYPKFLFPLADLSFSLKTVIGGATLPVTPTNFSNNDFAGETAVNKFAQIVEAALPPLTGNEPLMATPLVAQTPMDMREGWFVMRCVYERPLCGTIDPPVLSEPTKSFQIAGFFDPDAPARPIRIALPIDTTPAGLRKFNKNTAFMMSDLLCGQVNRMKGITLGDLIRTVLPFPLNKSLDVPDGGGCKDGDGVSIGMICSLSIPIITLCALILLMIIISLLDFIFRWMPFFIFCFPLPGLKGKDE